LAETKMPKAERRHRQAYLKCLELLPQLTDAEKEQVRLELITEAMRRGETDLLHEMLDGVAECPCCQRWLGHNRPPANEGNPPTTKAKQTTFGF
jgi:hypothetical protein